MSRLIDDIRRIKRVVPPWFVMRSKLDAWTEHALRVAEIIEDRTLPVILADNVAKYYWEATGQENWDLAIHFPNIAPPYEVFWVEHKFPKVIHSDEKGDTDVSATLPNGRVGWVVIGANRENVNGTGIPDEAHWLICAEQFIDYGLHKDRIDGPSGTITIAVDKNGRIVGNPFMQSYAAPIHNHILEKSMAWIHPVLLTVSFMHCKNVTVVDNRVPEKLAKKYFKHHGVKPTDYKTLVIEPLKAILRKEGKSDEVGVPKALHICRGHFKDYREGKGLFGKYHMLVWHDSVVRGTRGEKAPPREVEVKV